MTKQPNALEAQWIDDGFTPSPAAGTFVPTFATVYLKPEGEGLLFRVAVADSHCNGFHYVHGGFIATMADIFLGYNIAFRLPKNTRFVTATLGIDYLRTVESGQWLESAIDRVKMGSRLCHATGAILVDGSAVAAMHGTFAVLGTTGDA